MPIICIQCALRALHEGKSYLGDADATVEAHMQRCHPDPEATQQERKELEAALKNTRVTFGKLFDL